MKAVTELLDLFKGREVPVVEELPTADRPENGEKQPRNVDEKGHPEAEGESLSSDAQIGVKKIEATTKVWSKRSLIAAYILYGSSALPALTSKMESAI